MKKHFILTCIAYLLFGVGFTIQQIGIKAGLGLLPTSIIFAVSVIFFVVVMFTSGEIVKNKLFKKE